MPSTPSALLKLELQADGENLNAWGAKLNDLFSRMEEAVSGAVAITVSGPVTLTSTDYVVNQHRYAMLVLAGTGGTVTVPATSKTYLVKNGCTGAVTFTHGSGTTVTVPAGKIKWIATDGTDFFTAEEEDYLLLAGGTLTGLAKYQTDLSGSYDDRSLIDKAYGDTKLSKSGGTMTDFIVLHADGASAMNPVTFRQLQAAAFNAVDLPGQAGNSGKYLTTDGSGASWAFVDWSGIQNTPDTIAGYGITDAFTQTAADALYQPLDTDLTAIASLSTTSRGRLNLTQPTERRVSAATTAVFGDTILGDTTSAAFAVTLPAATAGSLPITIADDAGNAPTNNLTITPDGSETINGQSSIEIDQAYRKVVLIPQTGSWRITR